MLADLLDPHLLLDHLLLLDVGLDLVGLVGSGLLHLNTGSELRLLQIQVPGRLRLLGLACGLGNHLVLPGRRLRNLGFPGRVGALDGRVALRLGGRDVCLPLDDRDIRLAHVEDVLVLVAHFPDGEGDDLQPHFAHVVGYV